MRIRPSSLTGKSVLIVCALAALAFVVSGCGDAAETGANGAKGSGGASDGATAVTGGATSATAATGASGTTDGPTEQSGGVSPEDTQGSEGDEEGARTPVSITIKNGAFVGDTATRVHVPSFIAVELDVSVRDSREYQLDISRGGSDVAIVEVVKPGSRTIQLEGLRPGKTWTVRLGGEKLVVVADAEPGP